MAEVDIDPSCDQQEGHKKKCDSLESQIDVSKKGPTRFRWKFLLNRRQQDNGEEQYSPNPDDARDKMDPEIEDFKDFHPDSRTGVDV
jgi:hypothetical protein